MVFNSTFNNISVILWRSHLLVEETRITAENKQPVDPVYKYNYTCRYLIKKDISHLLFFDNVFMKANEFDSATSKLINS